MYAFIIPRFDPVCKIKFNSGTLLSWQYPQILIKGLN